MQLTELTVLERLLLIAVEAEYLTTVGKADRGIAGVEWEFSGFSVFGAASHSINDQFHARVRAGIISGEAKYSGFGTIDDTSFTSGVAAGMKIGDLGIVEIDWTGVGEDLYSLTAAFIYPF